jgi:hypothetical protein
MFATTKNRPTPVGPKRTVDLRTPGDGVRYGMTMTAALAPFMNPPFFQLDT